MNENVSLQSGAYIVEGENILLDVLVQQLRKREVIESNDPDVYIRSYRSFVIGDARDLRERAERKGIHHRRVFVLGMPGITIEAQNALLKVLEEPPAGALFFFLLPSPETLLPTLRSRMQSFDMGTHKKNGHAIDPNVFVRASAEKRLDMIKPLYDYDDDEGRDMASIISFLQSLEMRIAEEKSFHIRAEALESIYRARKYVGDKGSLLKSLLEQVALLVPKLM